MLCPAIVDLAIELLGHTKAIKLLGFLPCELYTPGINQGLSGTDTTDVAPPVSGPANAKCGECRGGGEWQCRRSLQHRLTQAEARARDVQCADQ